MPPPHVPFPEVPIRIGLGLKKREITKIKLIVVTKTKCVIKVGGRGNEMTLDKFGFLSETKENLSLLDLGFLQDTTSLDIATILFCKPRLKLPKSQFNALQLNVYTRSKNPPMRSLCASASSPNNKTNSKPWMNEGFLITNRPNGLNLRVSNKERRRGLPLSRAFL